MYAMLGDPPPPTHTNNYHSVILQFSDFTPFFLKIISLLSTSLVTVIIVKQKCINSSLNVNMF